MKFAASTPAPPLLQRAGMAWSFHSGAADGCNVRKGCDQAATARCGTYAPVNQKCMLRGDTERTCTALLGMRPHKKSHLHRIVDLRRRARVLRTGEGGARCVS
jgi:hypothetical protein